jgi:lipopolysaccharide export system permease protein
VIVGSPLGILTKGGNFGTSAMYSLGFYVIYWMSMIGGEEFADRGYLSPFLAMWLGNLIIGVIGVWITIRVNNR